VPCLLPFHAGNYLLQCLWHSCLRIVGNPLYGRRGNHRVSPLRAQHAGRSVPESGAWPPGGSGTDFGRRIFRPQIPFHPQGRLCLCRPFLPLLYETRFLQLRPGDWLCHPCVGQQPRRPAPRLGSIEQSFRERKCAGRCVYCFFQWGQPADKQHRLQLGRTRKRLPGRPALLPQPNARHQRNLSFCRTVGQLGLFVSETFLYHRICSQHPAQERTLWWRLPLLYAGIVLNGRNPALPCRSIRVEENVPPVGCRHHELATCLHPQQIDPDTRPDQCVLW
jgi:hypothetical protein